MSGWTWSDAAIEALKNTFGPGTRSSNLLALAAVVGVLQVLLAVHDSGIVIHQVANENRIGRNVVLLTAEPNSAPVKIDLSSCEALASRSNVARAGALATAGRDVVSQFGPLIPVMMASKTLVPELGSSNLVVGRSLSREPTGTKRTLSSLRFGAVKAVTGSGFSEAVDLNGALVIPFPRDRLTTNECVVVLNRWVNAETVAPLLGAQLKSTGGPILASVRHAASADPVVEYRSRVTRWMWLMLGLIGAGAAGLVVRFRASESAAYRLSGTSRLDLSRILMMEQVLVAGVAVSVGAQTTLLLHDHLVSPGSTLLGVLASGFAWSGAFSFIGPTLQRRNALSQARDR